MGVGFIKTPIFTRYFTPEEYGYLGLITITFSYISILVYSWLSGSVWRYYNAYKNKNDLRRLYSNLISIYGGATIIMFLVSIFWYMKAETQVVKDLILLSFVQYFLKELLGLYLIIVRLEGQSKKYTLIHSSRAIFSFILLYLMTFTLNYRITSVLTSVIVIDSIVLLGIVFFSRNNISFSIKSVDKKTLKLLFRFGSIGLVTNFSFLLISSSDRYLIALFTDIASVGIYNQVYNISQLSIVALVTVFFNTINPLLNKELEINFEKSNQLISNYLHVFFLFGLPVVTYLSLYSKELSFILLGEEFRSGYTIMPYIFTSALLYGLFLFIEIKFKFAEKLKNIAIGVIIAGIVNILLNLVLIPRFGYKLAAVSTLVSYLFIIFYFYIQDQVDFFNNRAFLLKIAKYIGILFLQVIVDKVLHYYFDMRILYTIIEAFSFLFVYVIVFNKEFRNLKIPV
jgi:O-antigen/teichoic acid export membrane protein